MKRLFVLLATALLAVMGSATSAQAANPHVVKGPDVTVSGNTLTVTASIAGLGNVPSAKFSLAGSVDLFSRCFNHGGNKPQADNKQETVQVDETGTFPVRNGRTNVSFRITPLSTLECPGKQEVRVVSLTWDLTLSGEGLTIPIEGSA